MQPVRATYICAVMKQRLQLNPAVSFSSASSNSLQDNTRVKWLWELNETQKEFYKANLCGTRMGTFVSTFNSAKQLSENEFREAVKHFQRKVPHLRTYVRSRGDSLWFCQPADFTPSFQVVEKNSNAREIVYDMVRNLMQNPETTSFDARLAIQRDDAVCEIQEVKATHPYQYIFLYTGHHSLMDGLGGAFVMRCFMEIMMKIMKGEVVDDEQYVSFYEEKQIPALLSHIKQKLIEDANFATTVRETMPPPDFIPLIFRAFPRPKPAVTTTRSVTEVMEPKLFTYFKRKCKREDITLNSFIVAVINIAVIELARKKGIIADSYMISPLIITNYRRYMKQSSEFYLGPCSGQLSLKFTVDANTVNNFWNYCKTINNDIHSCIKDGLPLHQGALSMLKDGEQSYDYISNLRPILSDYGVTNLGDLSDLMPKYDSIKLTDFRSMNLIHNFCHCNFHEIMSFNNRLYYTLSYPTNCLSDETAQLFIEKIFSIFEHLSKTSNL